jgi:hypothetical protein
MTLLSGGPRVQGEAVRYGLVQRTQRIGGGAPADIGPAPPRHVFDTQFGPLVSLVKRHPVMRHQCLPGPLELYPPPHRHE